MEVVPRFNNAAVTKRAKKADNSGHTFTVCAYYSPTRSVLIPCVNGEVSMAKTQKKNKKLSRGGKIALLALAALVLALALLVGLAAINADIVRVKRATVVLTDLPAAFDGTKLLYVTDIDLCGSNTPEKCARLFDQLQSLNPDILLLGGDYTSVSLFDRLNQPDPGYVQESAGARARQSFFHYINGFQAPLGKFAIAAPEDGDRELLRAHMEEQGLTPLFNMPTELRKGDASLWIVGISCNSSGASRAGLSFKKSDCVISALYSPELLPQLMTGEASDGGRWTDLVLTGHTHGGQVLLFGKSVLSLTSREKRYLSGWKLDSGVPILISQGLGCEGANLRLGTEPEVWLVTLKK